MATVTCVGIAVMDLLFQVDELPVGGGKFYASNYREIGGGVAANAAVAIARLGGDARLVSRVGDDAVGSRVKADLTSLGVDASQVAAVTDLTTPVSAVLVDSTGERTIVNHTPAELFGGCDTAAASQLADSDGVLVDVRWPDGASAALGAAAAAGIPSVFDFDRPMDNGGGDLLTTATHVAFSREALAATSGTNDPADGLLRMAERTEAWLAVTVGPDGVYWLTDGAIAHLPAFAVEVVDTAGAGDIFHGALALAIAEGDPEDIAIRFASAAAAIKCTRPGGRAGAPSRQEVEEMLKETF
ncbi:MAG: hypothetical protein GY720_00930 [bacterium]|nr:hypothetical protein [bacterium]